MNYRRIVSSALVVFCLGTANAQGAQRETDAGFDPIRSAALGSLLDDVSPARSHAVKSPGDADLGDQLLLQPASSYDPFTVYGGTDWRWVENAALTDGDEIEDSYWRHSAGATYLPRIVSNLYAEFGVNYDWYRYTDQSVLDFDALDARAGLANVFPNAGDLSVWASYDYKRLTTSGGNELLSDHGIEVGAFKPIPLHRDHQLYAGWVSRFSLDAAPEYARRDDHGVMFGYRYRPLDRIDVGAYYRLTLLDYHTGGRNDWHHHLGASIDYRLTDYATLSTSLTYQLNDSDLDGASYENLSAGAGLSLRIRF